MPRLDLKKKLQARSDRVKSCDLHPTEPWLLCSLFSGVVHVWNYHTQTLVKTFEVADAPVRAAKFIARKQWVVAASDDMYLRVFNYNTMKKVKSLEAHSDYIRSIAIHPTQSLLLTSSDDMSIKLWDWERNWQCMMIFEGHTHYVMSVAFNPKDPNTFASASLDRSIKVWGLNSTSPHFTLEGHEKGVNCVDYLGEGDKPYLVSGSDDRTAKVWDYQSKACVATLDAHTNNVTSVCFHPELPIIVTGSEDGTVRLWNSATYKPEKLVNNAMERAWCFATLRGSNLLAIGYDEGAVAVKFGRDEPAASMDPTGKLIWAKHSEVLTANVTACQLSSKDGGEKLLITNKELGRTEVYPRSIKHDPSGRFVAAVGDGEYTIYTALAWRNKSFGQAAEFVWGDASGNYAIREPSGGKVKLFANFKESGSLRLGFTPEAIFGGPLIGAKSTKFLVFYDWDGRLVRRIEVVPKGVFWSDNGENVVISTESAFYVLHYNAARVATALAAGAPGEEGIEDALEVVHEVGEKVRNGQWVGDCFVYTNGSGKLNYCVGGMVFTIAHLDRQMYLLGYLPREGKVYLIDKTLSVYAYHLHLAVVNYQTAVLRNDVETAHKLLPDIPTEERAKIAKFLQAQGKEEEALEVSTDDDHRFELALHLQHLEIALEIAKKTPNDAHRWRLLADIALRSCRMDLAEECMEHSVDLSGLLLLHTSLGDQEAVLRLGNRAKSLGKMNIAFLCNLVTRRIPEALDILCDSGRIAEAAFMARTYAPSHISRIVKLWRLELTKVNAKAAEALADPMDFPNLFPDLQDALAAEKLIAEEYSAPSPSTAEFLVVKAFLSRNLIEEAKLKTVASAPTTPTVETQETTTTPVVAQETTTTPEEPVEEQQQSPETSPEPEVAN